MNVVPHLILEKEGKVLLLHRTRTKVTANTWCTPCGGIEPGESPSTAIRRESFEELGIILNMWTHVFTLSYKGKDYFDPSKVYEDINLFFFADEYDGTPFNREPHKHGEMSFFKYDEWPSTTLAVIPFALRALKRGEHYGELDAA